MVEHTRDACVFRYILLAPRGKRGLEAVLQQRGSGVEVEMSRIAEEPRFMSNGAVR